MALALLAPREARCSQAHAADRRQHCEEAGEDARCRACRQNGPNQTDPARLYQLTNIGRASQQQQKAHLQSDEPAGRLVVIVGLLLHSLVQKTSFGETSTVVAVAATYYC